MLKKVRAVFAFVALPAEGNTTVVTLLEVCVLLVLMSKKITFLSWIRRERESDLKYTKKKKFFGSLG